MIVVLHIRSCDCPFDCIHHVLHMDDYFFIYICNVSRTFVIFTIATNKRFVLFKQT